MPRARLAAPTLARRLAAALGLAGTLAACVGDANPMRDAAAQAGFTPKAVEAPDFVARSRPRDLDYLPVGVAATPREARARSADSVRALQSELEGARAKNEARGGVRRGGSAGEGSAAPADSATKAR